MRKNTSRIVLYLALFALPVALLGVLLVVRSWKPRTLMTFGAEGRPMVTLAWSPDGSMICAANLGIKGRNGATLEMRPVSGSSGGWETTTSEPTLVDIGFAADGRSIVGAYALLQKTRGHVADVWDTSSGKLVRSLDASLLTGSNAFFMVRGARREPALIRAGFSPPSSPVEILIQKTVTFELSDAESGKSIRSFRVPIRGELPYIFALAPNNYLAAGHMVRGTARFRYFDSVARVFDCTSGKIILTLPRDQDVKKGIAIAPDGNTLASGRFDSSTQLWDIRARKKLRTVSYSEISNDCIEFSPDGRLLAIGGEHYPRIALWDVRTGQLERLLEGHSHGITDLAFAPDGATLASGSLDGTVRLWRLK